MTFRIFVHVSQEEYESVMSINEKNKKIHYSHTILQPYSEMKLEKPTVSLKNMFQAFRGGLGGTSKANRVAYKAFIELCQDRSGFTL